MDDAIRIPTAQNVALALAPAGAGLRVAAQLVDHALRGAYVLLWSLAPSGDLGVPEAVTFLFVALPVLLYTLAFEVFFEGQTPGKMACKIKVARLDGAQPTLGQHVLRWLLGAVDVLLSAGAVAVLAVAATRESQRLGDLAAGTTVVRRHRRVTLREARYPALPPGYVPRYPEAEHLTDAEVRTLRAVLARLNRMRRGQGGEALGRRAREAVERRLGVSAGPTPPEAFLLGVIRDHTAQVERYGLAYPPTAEPSPRPGEASTREAARSQAAASGP